MAYRALHTSRSVFQITRRVTVNSPLVSPSLRNSIFTTTETCAKAFVAGSVVSAVGNPFATQSKLGSLSLASLLALELLQVGNFDDGSR